LQIGQTRLSAGKSAACRLIEGRDIALDDMAQIVEAVHVGVEIASSPIQNINSFGPLVVVSDFGNNAGLVIGPKVEDPLGINYSDHMVSVDFNGTQIGAKPTGTGEAGPFGAVVFLVNHLLSKMLKELSWTLQTLPIPCLLILLHAPI